MEIFRAGFLDRAQVELRIQGSCRVEQFFVGKALRSDLKLVKRLSAYGVAKNRGHHRHVAGFDLLRLVACIDRQIRHSERASARLNEARVPCFSRRLEQTVQELLFRTTEATEKHVARIHEHHSQSPLVWIDIKSRAVLRMSKTQRRGAICPKEKTSPTPHRTG